MNISLDMLKEHKANIDDRLYSNDMKYLGMITYLDNIHITLRYGIHYNSYKIVNLIK